MKKSIRVLHTEWSDGWGGQEIRIINEMLAIREKGIEVFLACRDHAKIKEKAQEHNIQTFILPFNGSYDLQTIWKLYKIIKKHHIDIINTHSGKDTWTGGLAAKLAHVKFIRTRHLSNRINPSRLNFINELADFIFTTGESVKTAMIQNNRIKPEKILSIPTGIDERIFDPKKYDAVKEREILGIEKDEIAIGIIAVLRKFKRHDLFIKAAKQLIKKHNNLKFFIAGDGPKNDELHQLVKTLNLENHIRFLGHVKEPAKILAALDIFVLTSDSNEGVPQSVMQALLMHKKVIATNAGSTKDLYHENNFLLIKTNDLQAIIQAIESLLKNPNQLNLQRNIIIDHFSKNVMAKNIIEVYKQLCAEKAVPL
ncbi:glycosyltransferase family 4 protein [Sulfurospirillum sp. 1612]|uniref:glycosyltransferase family 4 protein n=1 Tax=Sulfurospirillum sp. 1612 TaxID=3094835 RepID=UPI002F9221F9